jgi:solute carrier family 13 (sodium-dependent dicarboxylate transporter), member 2/3/5
VEENYGTFQKVGLFAGVAAAIIILFFFDLGPQNKNAQIVAAVAALMSVWWITEALPLSITSLVPLILFPLTGCLTANAVSQAYMNSTILLFVGGFIIAIALEKWNLHKRIAINMIYFFGSSPSKLVFGFMAASSFISMWISNTATTLMVLPIGLAILFKIDEELGLDKTSKFATALLLGIAYGASIGGMATLIGTPTNLVFARVYKISFPDKPAVMFVEWMKFALPISLLMLFITWVVLTKIIFRTKNNVTISKEIIKVEKEKLGKMSYEEKAVAVVFFLTSLLWIFRSDMDLQFIKIPGWSGIFPKADFIDDGTVAMTMAFILFLIPTKSKDSGNNFVLGAEAIGKIPWDIVLLFGGGFAIAEGFMSSGLSKLIGQQLATYSGFHPLLLLIIICFVVTGLSELTSNTATAQIILPILASLSIELKIDPYLLMIPATLAASFGFMLPVGTPPNAIVFSSKRIKVIDMVRTGIIIDLLSVIVIAVYMFLYSK